MARKTLQEKFDARKEVEIVTLEKPMPGMPAGSKLLISTPAEIDAWVRAVPVGETRSVAQLRVELAKKHGADGTCALTTGIFLRVVAERALEQLAAGEVEIAPFWRVVEPQSPLAKNYRTAPSSFNLVDQLSPSSPGRPRLSLAIG
ncbi:hypothetical protein MCEMSE15_02944 [Fimbriimonadaceae bacterium]